MATKTVVAQAALSNPLTFALSPGMAPAAPLMRLLADFDRQKVEAFAEVSIALLNHMDGDEDLEPNGDDEPPEAEGDCRDAAWIEWDQTRGAQKGGPNIAQAHEDDEEDDPSGQYDEDCYTGPRPSVRAAGCPVSDPGGGAIDDEGHDQEGDYDYPGSIPGGGSGNI